MGNLYYEQLEKASECGNTKSNFKDRLIEEYDELFARRERLLKFLNEVDENKRPCDNSRSLLVAQLFVMDTYIQVLRLRFLELHMQWDDFHITKEGENDEGN